MKPGQPGQRLERFPESHVVGQDAAEFQPGEVAQEIEALLAPLEESAVLRQDRNCLNDKVQPVYVCSITVVEDRNT